MWKKITFILLGIALFFGCLMACFAGTTYYIDPSNGNDGLNGLKPSGNATSVRIVGAISGGQLKIYQPATPTTVGGPWKHAPNDPSATAVAAATTLLMDDIVFTNSIVDADYEQGFPTNCFFFDDFERGDYRLWPMKTLVGTGSLVNINSNKTWSGICSGEFVLSPTGEARRSVLDCQLMALTNEHNLYIGGRFYIPSSFVFSNGVSMPLLGFYKSGYAITERYGVYPTPTNLVIYSTRCGNLTNIVSRDVWHTIEGYYSTTLTNGSSAIWLDGVLCKQTNNVAALTNYSDGFRFGSSLDNVSASYPTVGGTIYIDDVYASTNFITFPTNSLKLVHPDFRGRIGGRVSAILAQQQSTDTFELWKRVNDGSSSVLITNISNPSGRVDAPVDLRGIPQSMVSIQAVLRESNGNAKLVKEYRYAKNYSGNPEYSIDEKNNFTTNGIPYFQLTPFILSSGSVASWASSNVINSLFGGDFSSNSFHGISNSIALAESLKLPFIAPLPMQNAIVKGSTNETTVSTITNLVYAFKDLNYVAGWSFIDEPELYNYTGNDCYQWWQCQKRLDPSHINMLNLEGDVLSGSSDYRSRIANQFNYPFLSTDVISGDAYPYEYASQSLGEVAMIVQRGRAWNHDTIPVCAYVNSCDVHPTGLGPITPQQINCQAWLSVINGVKGLQWFQYFGDTTPSNLVKMAEFKSKVDAYTPWILNGNPLSVSVDTTYPIIPNIPTNSGLYCSGWSSGGTNKIFVLNVLTTNQLGTIYMNGLLPTSVVSNDLTGVKATAATNSFSDTFTSETVHIYTVTP